MTNKIETSSQLLCFEAEFRSMGLRQSTGDAPTLSTNQRFSDLYTACSQNDLDLVRVLLQSSTFEEINTHEINGSTALHLAVQLVHVDLVRLLLDEYGVCRHRTDSQGHTAFQLATTDEIR
jgi:ankyrin repeat protein